MVFYHLICVDTRNLSPHTGAFFYSQSTQFGNSVIKLNHQQNRFPYARQHFFKTQHERDLSFHTFEIWRENVKRFPKLKHFTSTIRIGEMKSYTRIFPRVKVQPFCGYKIVQNVSACVFKMYCLFSMVFPLFWLIL